MTMGKAVRGFVATMLLTALTMGVARAQDPLKAASDVYKLVFENDRVRVLEVSVAPGAKIAKHSHPDHFGYVLSAGKLKISKEGAEAVEAEPKVGEVLWIPAETHWGENTGQTDLRILVVELKEPAPKKAKKAATTKTN